ncbi:MAG: HepT-like ribonuclease domain-containing protein [Acidimicrobiales bacterium]
MNERRTVRERLSDILEAIDDIRSAREVLVAAQASSDESVQRTAVDACLYNLVVIGEAVRVLPEDVTSLERDVPWRDIVGMRNYLAHEYHRVVITTVLSTIDSLADLEGACRRLHACLDPRDGPIVSDDM